MFKYLKPNNLLKIINKTQKFVFIIFLVIISIGLVEALILSPEDYKQSHSVRIMYVHVPAAWISLGIFSAITFLSIVGYIFKLRNFFLLIFIFKYPYLLGDCSKRKIFYWRCCKT